MGSETAISSDEIAQYDRQIRLWGLDAQKRLRQANVLVIGVGGLGSEVVKNIVLAGVHSITLQDAHNVTEEDLISQLLVNPKHVGENIAKASQSRTQELNPNVIVQVDCESITEKSNDYFDQFHVVCLTRCNHKTRESINDICREKGIKFFCGDVYGFFGYFFSDLGTHEFAVEIPVKKTPAQADDDSPAKKNKFEESTVTVKKVLRFCSYKDALCEDWSKRSRKELRNSSPVFFILSILDEFRSKHDRLPSRDDTEELLKIKTQVLSNNSVKESFVDDDFATSCFSILSPVAAVVAGVLGQEIIKAISMKDAPHKNFFFFDGLKHVGTVDDLGLRGKS